MSRSTEHEVYNMLSARANYAVSAAGTLLAVADPCNALGDVPLDWETADVRSRAGLVDSLMCGLLQFSGVPWEVFAATSAGSVSRQALHQRLARVVLEERDQPNVTGTYTFGSSMTGYTCVASSRPSAKAPT
jgi:hypothetical protein